MDAEDVPTPRPPGRRALLGLLAAAALVVYGLVLARYAGAVAGGSDSSGYLNLARLISSGRIHVPARAIEGLPAEAAPSYLYVPLGFRPSADAKALVPTYPVGFPLFVALLAPLVGWAQAGNAAIILNSILGLVSAYALLRESGLGPKWALIGTVILATSPLYLSLSLQAMSDIPSLCWTTAAVASALRSWRRPAWALGAGIFAAVAVLLRPTNALAFVPLAIALGAHGRRWLYLILGGLPGAAVFALYNRHAYGAWVATGYGDVSSLFSAGYVPSSLRQYLRLPLLFTPVVLLGFGLPWVPGVPVRIKGVLGSWFLLYAAFYAAYFCTHENWGYLRFLLPAAPALVAAGLLVVRAIPGLPLRAFARRRPVAALAGCAAVLILYGAWRNRALHALSFGRQEREYEVLCSWLKSALPPDALCVSMQASGALFYYTDFPILRWDMVRAGESGRVIQAARRAKRPLYAILFPFELDGGALSHRVKGDWTLVGKSGTATLWLRQPEVLPAR